MIETGSFGLALLAGACLRLKAAQPRLRRCQSRLWLTSQHCMNAPKVRCGWEPTTGVVMCGTAHGLSPATEARTDAVRFTKIAPADFGLVPFSTVSSYTAMAN